MNINLSVNEGHTNKVVVKKAPDVDFLSDSRDYVSHNTIYLGYGPFLLLVVQTLELETGQGFFRVRNNLT